MWLYLSLGVILQCIGLSLCSTCSRYGFDVVLKKLCPAFTDPACYYAFEKWGKPNSVQFQCNSVDALNSTTFELVDSTKLRQILSKTDDYGRYRCSVVLFYSAKCIYSQKLILSYSYLTLLFPKMGFYLINLDSKDTDYVINKYGITATPTMLLYANGSTYARIYDGQKKLKKLVRSIVDVTDLEVVNNVTLHEYEDFEAQLKDIEEYKTHYEGVEGLTFEDTKTYLDRGFALALVVLMINMIYFTHRLGYISIL
ncbi:unnamed protein product [Bursaphelenchus okinawaensis]|uniref:Thioredoxin domain-containing protein n=1 Tax=Bursaphelenchus okinawaensis TaxID=465554 RepID=A0A811KS30_9BILA|nr:unnamed protein product [Bursaphelenchus okinawaensis]CAG9112222.1 unnamed protein product [Bursaphelenchus okinawaensis]